MSTLKAPFVQAIPLHDVEVLHSVLNEQPRHALKFCLWKEGNENTARVSFSMAHTDDSVLLKFFVEEKEIRANVTNINGPVWEDSCVEFFVSFDDGGYYNFEFNCLGTALAAFGKNRKERKFLPEAILKKIQTATKLTKKDDHYYWEIGMIVPVKTFLCHSLHSLSGVVGKGNFYKCGNALPQPHYLAWSEIQADKPDFHLPEFFGDIVFE